MAKNKLTIRKSENVQIAKINALQVIIVALIAAMATAIPAYFVGKHQGERTLVIDPPLIPKTNH